MRFPAHPGPVRRWDGSKWVAVAKRIWEVPQVQPHGLQANLLFQMYPVGLRSATAHWNATEGRYMWPEAPPVVVTNTVDGGISRPCIWLRGRGRLFHIGGDGVSDAHIGGGILGAFSDDFGSNWSYSTSNVSVPAHPHCQDVLHGACGGGDEPMTVELSNGSLWTLIRTPGGGNQTAETSTVWQTMSNDGGQSFHEPTPMPIITHDAPVLVLRLERATSWMTRAGISHGPTAPPPILLVWTNTRQGPGRKINEASRMLLHAAVSFDEGATFHGHREIMRDPLAKVSISPTGRITDDYGVGYPSGVEQADGSVLIEAGQGNGRWGVTRLDPAWLLETTQSANFANANASRLFNDARDFSTALFVSGCAWDAVIIPPPPPGPPGPSPQPEPLPPHPKHEIGGGWLIDCAKCNSTLGSGFWQPINSSTVHPVLCDRKLPTCCSKGECRTVLARALYCSYLILAVLGSAWSTDSATIITVTAASTSM
jgi:hypothetical protein